MSTDEPMPTDAVGAEEPTAAPEAEEAQVDHPHAGVAAEGYSSPMSDFPSHEAACGEIVLKRGGAPTDVKFPISPPAIIGRFDPAVGPIDVDLASVPEGSYVSRKHAKITFDDGVWTLSDMGSSNGTFILRNDFERVDQTELKDGDEFALGNARFSFHIMETCEIPPA
jgi:hypothetical protein